MLDFRNLLSFFAPIFFLIAWLFALVGWPTISLPLLPGWLQGATALLISVYFLLAYTFSWSDWFKHSTHLPVYAAVIMGNLELAGLYFQWWSRDAGWSLIGYVTPLPSADPWGAILAVSFIFLILFEVAKRIYFDRLE